MKALYVVNFAIALLCALLLGFMLGRKSTAAIPYNPNNNANTTEV